MAETTLHALPMAAAAARWASLAPARPRAQQIPTPRAQRPEHKSSSSPSPVTLGRDVEHRAVLVGKVGFGDALNVARLQVQKGVDFRVGGRDVVVDDRGMRQMQRLLLVAFPANDVVAHELIL